MDRFALGFWTASADGTWTAGAVGFGINFCPKSSSSEPFWDGLSKRIAQAHRGGKKRFSHIGLRTRIVKKIEIGFDGKMLGDFKA